MDSVFFQGMAAFISAILIFCGSIWLLLTMILGARLAYFITASITLGFTFIMGVVWSINPLGPVGQSPEWDPVAIGEEVSALEFGPASAYPDSPWRAPVEDDQAEATKVGGLEGDAADSLAAALEEGTVTTFEDDSDAQADDEGTRLLEQDGELYGAITFQPIEGAEGGTAIAILKYDPGNPLGKARMITAGTFLLFGAHLFGLSRSEKAARRRTETAGGDG